MEGLAEIVPGAQGCSGGAQQWDRWVGSRSRAARRASTRALVAAVRMYEGRDARSSVP